MQPARRGPACDTIAADMYKWVFTILLFPVCAFAQAKLLANYNLSARLNPTDKSVTGHETLLWKNDSQDTIPELQFHLYMNAFKNTKSTFIRESGGELRGDRLKKDSWGYLDIQRMQIAGGADLTKSIRFIAPDDGNADDQTVIRVPLPNPVAAGGQIQLEIDFYTVFPHVYARAGYHGDFFLGGQWFPKIGVWEKAGMRYATTPGWNCHQYHATSEFYADYGRYAVDLTVPSNFVVGATGVQKNEQKNTDGTTTYSFYQENVHDFAWTAQPTYLRFVRTFEAEREVSPSELTDTARMLGISHEDARLSNVQMILLLQPEHSGQVERHFRATANAIKYFGLWYGRYPHATITVVDPPAGAGGADGMEYPTFITAGTSWLIGKNDGTPEEVIVHEFGHQFWQGLVGNNEFEEAWMDEGFNTFSTGKVMDLAYGRRNIPFYLAGVPLSLFIKPPTIGSDEMDRTVYLILPKADDLARRAWQYQNFESYGINSYMRTGAMLRTLENTLGEATMTKVMRTYQQRWRYDHPAFPDFINVVNQVSGKDMTWFFQQFVYSSNIVDYAVAEATSEVERAPAGIIDQGPGHKTVRVEDAAKIDKEKAKNKKETFRTKITIRREGEAIYPVDILARFENGETERRQWDGQYRWVKYEFLKPSKLESVVVDPEHKLVLDADWSNNSYVVKPKSGTTVKWSSSILFWVQQMLQTLSLLA
jgi:Peptidase family M1 domain